MYIYYNARQPPVRKVDVRLPGQGNGARPVHLITTMIKWIRTSRLSTKDSLSQPPNQSGGPTPPWLTGSPCTSATYPESYISHTQCRMSVVP